MEDLTTFYFRPTLRSMDNHLHLIMLLILLRGGGGLSVVGYDLIFLRAHFDRSATIRRLVKFSSSATV